VVVLVAIATWAAPIHPHGGGLDASGCHHDRKNGGYHCHRSQPTHSGSSPAAVGFAPERSTGQPIRLTSDEPFANCTAARAAGAAPVRRGQPGYGPHLDRDNNGIGCE